MFGSLLHAILELSIREEAEMAQIAIDGAMSRTRARIRFSGFFPVLATRWAEHREVRRWLRQHPPSLGRSTGARV